MEQISPLCVRIKNAFSKNEIKIIHSTYQSGIQPIMCINPTSKLKVKFDKKYIECEALGSFKIYNDENDEKDEKKGEDKEDLVQINICESEYTKKHGIANVNCFIPTNRIDENDLRRNHSRILCKTESRNFGVLSGDTVNGHIVTYLDSIFSIYAKHIYSKMMNYCKYVDKNMKWELLNNDSYQTKCIEYIQYQKQNDNLGWHCDLGSLVTIVIMLANSNEYEGANLQVKKLVKVTNDKYIEQEPIDVHLESGDIAVFSADKCNHRVTNLTKGKRVVLVMELVFW